MTIKDFEYDSDTSLPDELKNTNHLNPIDAGAFDSDTDNNNTNSSGQEVIPDIYFHGFTADYKGNQRHRAQLAQKSRAKATQSYIQKKTKRVEDKDRIERKQEQKKKAADQQLEEKEEASEDTIRHSMASIIINAMSRPSSEATNNSSKSEPDLEQESTRPEDEVLEPRFTAVVDASDNEVDLALEEEEKIQFKHNLNFKTDRDDTMPAKPLNSRDWKQIFSQKLQERDRARERQKEKERNQA
ncbi:hypothetical protein BGZ80_005391 [Entomortierella chlamydospora]|uniref:Uncharacterized protein n=1 Tax=Entomortierella chlamydospora TaxID=101097 RepID=A0A9P6T2S9_9FUNG|nr:hypothetical protein BGZ80_005391 [Entomortierella chlamydospora]